MQKSLTLDDYVAFFEDVDISRCVYIIKLYFNGDVNAFYKAPSKFKEWSVEKSFYKREAMFKPAWDAISHYNFVGIHHKWLKRIFGKNYYSAQFMQRVWDKVYKTLHFTYVHHGTLTYKGEEHSYPAKYLPPKERLQQIFSNPKLVERILNTSNYCNKVKKILDAMIKENTKKAGKDVSSWGRDKANQRGVFTSPEHLLGRLWAFLQKGDAGTPMGYYNVLKPIVTDYLYNSFKKEWLNGTPQSIQNKYVGDDMMTNEERKAIAKKQLKFVMKIRKQLDGPNASKMFKDEKIGTDKNGEGIYKPADEKRIAKASEAVDLKIARLNEIINGRIAETSMSSAVD